MKTLLILALVICLSFQTGHCLDCHVCALGQCTTMTCPSEQVCGKIVSSEGTVKSCLPKSGCDVSAAGIKTYCCETNLCNSAISTRMSVFTVIAAFVTLWILKP